MAPASGRCGGARQVGRAHDLRPRPSSVCGGGHPDWRGVLRGRRRQRPLATLRAEPRGRSHGDRGDGLQRPARRSASQRCRRPRGVSRSRVNHRNPERNDRLDNPGKPSEQQLEVVYPAPPQRSFDEASGSALPRSESTIRKRSKPEQHWAGVSRSVLAPWAPHRPRPGGVVMATNTTPPMASALGRTSSAPSTTWNSGSATGPSPARS